MLKKLGIGCGGLVLLLIVVGIIGGSQASKTTVTSAGSGGTTTATTSAQPQAKVGDTVTSGNWTYTVTKVEKVKTLAYSTYSTPIAALGQWVVVSLTLKNIGKQNFPINDHDFQISDSGGTIYDTSSKLEVLLFIDKVGLTHLGSQFPPGIDVKSAVIFDVNPVATGLKLVLKQATGTTIALE